MSYSVIIVYISRELSPFSTIEIFDIDIGFIDVTLSWVVPYTLQYQRYSVVYGIYPDVLNQSSGIQISSLDLSAVNQTFTETLIGLSQGVTYYMRVSSTFGFSIIYSDIVSFTTLEPGTHKKQFMSE